MTLAERLSAAPGVVAGVSVAGERDVAAAGLANVRSGRAMSPSLTIPVASLTKPVLATAVVRLMRQRRLSLATPVVKLVPALAPDWRAAPGLTLAHVLSHTSGLRPDIPLDEAASYGDGDDALEQAVRATVRRGQVLRLGSAWQYGNAGYALAGHALGSLSWSTFEQALATAVLVPAGMGRAGFGEPEALGHAHGQPVGGTYFRARRPGGGLIASVDDMLSFAEWAMDDQETLAVTGRSVAASQLGSRYGLGWNISHGRRVLWHTGDWGGCHSALLLAPASRVAVVVVVNDDAAVRLRRDLAWAELTRLTGLWRPRLAPGLRIAQSLARGALASLTRPRPADG